ncbi:hypothetical protein PHMEG_00019239 [Phytophthora megakarya]|uniref:Polyprotein n=1 Tax=Phytophthora megakarya TaxID=4795 RepID=A0A225VSV4_9STRA|nr:hypothetical protein PHMEG_00019239 [Phytophthora megakarya]
MEGCAPVATPQLRGVELEAEPGMSAQQMAAQDCDSRGLYLVIGTRPDIANVVRELSKYLSCYNKTHSVVVRRVLTYLKRTSTYGLLLDGNSRMVTYEVYTDASFAVKLKNASQSQKLNSLHLAKALKKGNGVFLGKPVRVWCDSKAAISTVKNPGNHKATKNIEIIFLFTSDIVEEGRLEIQYCSKSDMAADILIKALPTGQFIKLTELTGVKDLKTTGDT